MSAVASGMRNQRLKVKIIDNTIKHFSRHDSGKCVIGGLLHGSWKPGCNDVWLPNFALTTKKNIFPALRLFAPAFTWPDAVDFCHSLGGALWEPRNMEDVARAAPFVNRDVTGWPWLYHNLDKRRKKIISCWFHRQLVGATKAMFKVISIFYSVLSRLRHGLDWHRQGFGRRLALLPRGYRPSRP